MATHSSVLAGRIPGTGEPGRLLSMRSHRVWHNWSDLAAAAASVRSIPLLSFIVPIFAWNIPLVSLIFLKSSLVFPILLFSSISLHWSLRKAFLSPSILWNSAFRWIYLSFSPLPFFFPLDLSFIFFPFIFISWRLITLQYCSGFCHTLTWISHGFTCIPHPDPPSHLPLYPVPLGLPSAPGPSTCLTHPTWAGDLFHPR